MLSRLFARREPQARPLFALGSLRLSEKVHWLASKGLIDPLPYVQRHVRGDWGDVPSEDAKENDFAVTRRLRLLSSYTIAGERVWIITEADRRSTSLLFPSEY